VSARDQRLAASNLDAYFAGRTAPGRLDVRAGDRVALTRYHLLQLGLPATDPAWRRAGTVEEIRGDLALVRWDGGEVATLIASANLAHPGPNRRFCE
jgi:hypothetical protein